MKRLTISVPDAVALKAQRAVSAGMSESVSGYFAALAENEPDWVLFREVVADLLAEAGGVSDEARTWARDALDLVPGEAEVAR
jgi:predicted Zn-dependent protease